MTPRNRDIPLAGPFPQFRKLHWRCLLDTRHVWVESVQSRISNKSVCPTCTGLGKLEEQTKEHERINNLSKAEFHPDLNHCAGPAGMLSARDKVWWTCPKKPEHKWQCSYRYRLLNRDTVCKQCQRVGRKRGKEFERRKPVSEQSSFLASEWHSTKNGSLRPTDSIPRHTSIWWQCAVQKDHVWKTKIQNRVYARSGCPYCRGVKVGKDKALSVVNPKLASEWHPTKNGSKLPSDSLSRQTKVWWCCTQNPEEHVWETSIWRRLENGCPFCRGRRTDSKSAFKVRPDLRNQWHPTLNQIDPDSLLPKSNRPVWWRCPRCRDFSWCSSMRSRIDVSDLVPCYKCFGHEHNRHFLSNVDPLIASLWHPTLNGSLRPSDVLCVSKMSFWWLCPAGHQWMGSVGTTRSRPGCSKCLKVDSCELNSSESLVFKHKLLSAEWHPELNRNLWPAIIRADADRIVWWLCPRHGRWQGSVKERSQNGVRCTQCVSQGLSPLSPGDLTVAAMAPGISAEWADDLNSGRPGLPGPDGILVSDVRLVWWRCRTDPDHVFQRSVFTRVFKRQNGRCPECTKAKRQSMAKQNSKTQITDQSESSEHIDRSLDRIEGISGPPKTTLNISERT
eukprot:531116_1